MSFEWSKFAWIMEREDQELKRAMEAEVSISSVFFGQMKNEMLTGGWNYCPA